MVPLLDGNEWDSSVTVEGYTRQAGEEVGPHMNYPEPGLFATLGVAISRGRDFRENDDSAAPKVAIVNELFAQ